MVPPPYGGWTLLFRMIRCMNLYIESKPPYHTDLFSVCRRWNLDWLRCVMPMRVTDPLRAAKRGSPEAAIAFAGARGARRLGEVKRYVRAVYRLAPKVGLDPAIVVSQASHETASWTSFWWNERLNPAGIGITG